jgi:UDP-N-acetylmuramate dehydrogenase
MRVGGPAGTYAVASTTEELVALVREADRERRPVLVVGGGSNLVVGDEGFDGLVIRVATAGIRVEDDTLTLAAGADWDTAVCTSLEAGLAGLEALSGIPGSAGGTPIQNVGAYGSLTSDHLDTVTVFDRQRDVVETWGPGKCEFGPHRQSVFKHSRRYIVLEVRFRLVKSTVSTSIKYDALAQFLGVPPGSTAPVDDVRQAVLQLRSARGMVLDPTDHDTWSVGSFFLNPVLQHVPEQAAACPAHPDPSGTKLPAAWLIHNAGFAPGYGREWGRGTVTLSTKHTLAVTNRGGATTAEVMTFAAHIRDGVQQIFGVRLSPECDLVNCRLDETPAPVPTGSDPFGQR